MFFMLSSVQGVTAQSSSHGEPFALKKEINRTSNIYQDLKVSESLNTQIKGIITDVCQVKGCWMKVNLDDEQQVFVKFKDYGFFVPTDSAGKEVVMNGQAFIEEMSVDEQQHYSMDRGATKDEVAKITQPKKTLRFEADGVYISN